MFSTKYTANQNKKQNDRQILSTETLFEGKIFWETQLSEVLKDKTGKTRVAHESRFKLKEFLSAPFCSQRATVLREELATRPEWNLTYEEAKHSRVDNEGNPNYRATIVYCLYAFEDKFQSTHTFEELVADVYSEEGLSSPTDLGQTGALSVLYKKKNDSEHRLCDKLDFFDGIDFVDEQYGPRKYGTNTMVFYNAVAQLAAFEFAGIMKNARPKPFARNMSYFARAVSSPCCALMQFHPMMMQIAGLATKFQELSFSCLSFMMYPFKVDLDIFCNTEVGQLWYTVPLPQGDCDIRDPRCWLLQPFRYSGPRANYKNNKQFGQHDAPSQAVAYLSGQFRANLDHFCAESVAEGNSDDDDDDAEDTPDENNTETTDGTDSQPPTTPGNVTTDGRSESTSSNASGRRPIVQQNRRASGPSGEEEFRDAGQSTSHSLPTEHVQDGNRTPLIQRTRDPKLRGERRPVQQPTYTDPNGHTVVLRN